MRLFRSILLLTLLAAAAPAAVLAWVLFTLAWRPGAGPGGPWVHLAIGLGVLAISIAPLLAAWFARRLTEPVSACVQGALEIARGRFGHQVPVSVRNEVGELAYAFNHMSRELAGYDRQNRELIAELEAGYLATLRSLASAIDAKDPSTHGHSQRVAELSMAIGHELGLEDVTLKALAYGGLLHDLGKIGVPEAILHKAGRLDPTELEQMRAHPVIGAEILRGVEFLEDALAAVRHHHERWDGGGYPDGLAGTAIPIVARIVNAADTFDACTTPRPYQPVLSAERGVVLIEEFRGTQVDPDICDALVRVIRRRTAIGATG